MTEMTATEVQIRQIIAPLQRQIAHLEELSLPPPTPDRAELYAALAKAQGEIKAAEAKAEADMGTYTFRYADLAACLDVIRKPLSDNELCLIQIPSLLDNDVVHMRTVLGHSSGQTISCEMSMTPEKGGPQAIGTCMSYLRRYSLCALIGVAQFDDDARSATKGPGEYERLSPRDIDELLVKADELFGDDADAVLETMCAAVFPDAKGVADIPADQLKFALERLDNKKKRDTAKAKKKAADEKKAAEPKPKPAKPKAQQDAEREPGSDDA